MGTIKCGSPTNQIPFEKVLRGNPHCTFAVNFRCYPFFYADAAADITVTKSGTMITNPGSAYSEPILTVTGSGDITLMVGTTIVELENISGSIIIRGRVPLTEFRDANRLAMVDYITVHSKDDIRLTFKDGTEIKA